MRQKENKTNLNARVSSELLQRMHAVIDQKGMTVSGFVEIALREKLDGKHLPLDELTEYIEMCRIGREEELSSGNLTPEGKLKVQGCLMQLKDFRQKIQLMLGRLGGGSRIPELRGDIKD